MSENESGIRLEFAQFGHFDSFDVIRSMVSMVGVADADLPTPIATGLKTMYYVDKQVLEGARYYYKVRVRRGIEQFVSDEVSVMTNIKDPYLPYVKALVEVEYGAVGDEMGRVWSKVGSPIITSDQSFSGLESLYVDGSGGYSTADTEDMRIGTLDYTIECWFRPTQIFNWGVLFQKGAWNSPGGLTLIIGGGTIKICADGVDSGDINHGLVVNQWVHVALSRVSGVLHVFINGVKLRQYSQPQNLNGTSALSLGVGGGIVGVARGHIDMFRLTVGYGRYTENFEPPETF